MSMDMSDEDKKVLDSTEEMDLEIKPLQPKGAESGFSSRDLAEQSKPKQTPEDFWAAQKKQMDSVRESNNPYGKNPQKSPSALDSDANKKANETYRR